jgi:predicted ATP-grasp superfamily ATP-dependent carboligase
MSRTRVLVTSAMGDAGLAAVRSLARSGFEVHSADISPMPFGKKSRYVSAHHVLADSPPGAHGQALLDLVKTIHPDVLLPIGSRGVAASLEHYEALRNETALSLPDRDAVATANNKSAAIERCESLGIPSARVYSNAEAEEVLSSGGGNTAIVVKPQTNVGAARGVTYVDSVEKLRANADACAKRYGAPLIQEYVPGDVNDMRTVVVLFSHESELIAAFTTAKRRQWPATGGLTVVSHSTDDPALVDRVLPFFRSTRWRGPAEVELKRDPRTGVEKVIEINPRFPAYLRFAAFCGLDLPTLAARLAMLAPEEPRPYPSYSIGRMYMNPGLLLKSALWHARRRSPRELRKVVAEFGTGFPLVLEMLGDPYPFVGRALEDLRRVPSAALDGG